MNKRKGIAIVAALALVFGCAAFLRAQEEEQPDLEGSKDHPLLSRMKNFFISDYRDRYDEHEFYINADRESKMIEGELTSLDYQLKDGAPQPSPLQIKRNYMNALKTLGAKLLFEDEDYACWNLVKGDQEFWMDVQVYNDGATYTLTIVQIAAMAQEVTANAMLEALNKDGFIALYINFESGRSDLKPEMQETIDQIAALLTDNEDLRVSIEGHTDNVGQPESNKALSERRAEAVRKAVIDAGVDPSRIGAVGWGQERPIADNRSEEGRAKNRRVEIVKK